MTQRQIIAMGGGGFSMEPDNPLLDQYVLSQSSETEPEVCFLPPSGEADYTVRFYTAFTKLKCRPSHLSLFRPPTADLESFLLEKDIIYVGGGNTKSMLALWREWELDRILRLAWQQGTILCGLSAGSICWFEWGITDSIPGTLSPIRCLGFLKGSNCPHYDGEAERKPAFHRLLREGGMPEGYAADDGAALHFLGSDLHKVISSRQTARAYRVYAEVRDIREQELAVESLGQESGHSSDN